MVLDVYWYEWMVPLRRQVIYEMKFRTLKAPWVDDTRYLGPVRGTGYHLKRMRETFFFLGKFTAFQEVFEEDEEKWYTKRARYQ